MQIEQIPLKELTPYTRNSRTHSEEQITQVVASIVEYGWTNPVLIDDSGMIIAGHGRTMAAARLKMTEVPCIRLSNLSENQKRAYIIADNQIALNAGWDEALLHEELEALKIEEYDLQLLGFSDAELDDLLTDTEEEVVELPIPEPPVNPTTKLGEIYQLGNHRLMCGDSTSIDAVERLMDGRKADMVFTDPPYGMFLDADYSAMGASGSMTNKTGNKYDNVIGDHEDFNPDFINNVFKCFDYCKEIFLWGADYYSEYLVDKNNGSWVVWDKRANDIDDIEADESSDKMYGSCFELCWSRNRHKRDIARVKWAGIFGTSKEFDKKRVHPTQKPTLLAEWFFDRWGANNDLVVDIYLGSGSTLIAAENKNRKCYGMELDPKYVDVIIKRWQEYTGKKAIHAESGDEFVEVDNGKI